MFSENNSLIFLNVLNALILTRDLIESLQQFVDGEMIHAMAAIVQALTLGFAQ